MHQHRANTHQGRLGILSQLILLCPLWNILLWLERPSLAAIKSCDHHGMLQVSGGKTYRPKNDDMGERDPEITG